jgi:hypothetical protein
MKVARYIGGGEIAIVDEPVPTLPPCHFPKSASVTFQSRLQQRHLQQMRESKITLRQ